jgi:hypothetical protein
VLLVVEQLQLLARLLLELVAQLVVVLRQLPVRLVELLVQPPEPQEPVVLEQQPLGSQALKPPVVEQLQLLARLLLEPVAQLVVVRPPELQEPVVGPERLLLDLVALRGQSAVGRLPPGHLALVLRPLELPLLDLVALRGQLVVGKPPPELQEPVVGLERLLLDLIALQG